MAEKQHVVAVSECKVLYKEREIDAFSCTSTVTIFIIHAYSRMFILYSTYVLYKIHLGLAVIHYLRSPRWETIHYSMFS